MQHQDSNDQPRTLFYLLLVVFIICVGAVIVGISRNSVRLQQVQISEATVQTELDLALTEQVHLQETLAYVDSLPHVEEYNRDEANKILPGEKVVQVVTIPATPQPAEAPPPTPDPANFAQPWQMWWHLLFDSPAPTR